MSTRTAFSIVGAAIGAYFGNAALGYSIGSMVGGYVDPVEVKGPRISDAQQQTSQDGVPIPITYGRVRISGNIIASGPLNEHKKKDDGKGSGTETTTYYYTRTYAIGICEGPIEGISRIWRDGKLVFDSRPDVFKDRDLRVASAKYKSIVDFYYGDEAQEPNSALQAIFGADEVPAHRGMAYIVVREEDVTDRGGSVPTLEFEIVQLASLIPGANYRAVIYHRPLWLSNASIRVDPRSNNTYRYAKVVHAEDLTTALWRNTLSEGTTDVADYLGLGGLGQMMGWSYIYYMNSDVLYDFSPYDAIDNPANARVLGLVFAVEDFLNIADTVDASELTRGMCEGGLFCSAITNAGSPAKKFYTSGVITNSPTPTSSPSPIYNIDADPFFVSPNTVVAVKVLADCTTYPQEGWLPLPATPGYYVSPDGTIFQVGTCDVETGSFRQLQVQELSESTQYIAKFPVGPAVLAGGPDDTEDFWVDAYEQAVFLGQMPPGLVYGQYPQDIGAACYCSDDQTVDPRDPLLASIVADLCKRKGLLAEDIDVSQLTDFVKGFTIATSTTAADAINALAPAYQFDGAEFDGKTRFIKRGGPTLAALNEDDAFDSDDGRIVETRAQELELPRKLALSYMDLDANYAVTTQMAERYSVSVSSSGTDSVQLPVVMLHDKAAQTVDILLKDKWSSINGTLELSVGDDHSDLVPTDVLYLSYGEALFRCRVVEAENAEGVVKLNLQQDTALAYSSIAPGVPPRPAVEGRPTVMGPTFLEVMNIPALRDQDDQVGFYVAGNSPIGRWPGAQIAVSSDDGETWTDIRGITQGATLGNLEEGINLWPSDIVDRDHPFDVFANMGDFESISEAQLFNGGNPLCIGNEVVQFETAELIDTQLYRLNGTVVRGRKNTDPVAWPMSTRVVSLQDAYFIPVDRSLIGRQLKVRATTSGTDVQYGTVVSLDFTVVKSSQEWNVTNLKAARDGSHTAHLTWSPRHRLGTSLMPYPSKYFNGYQVVVSDGSTSRTYPITSPSFDYTDAQATADFGSVPSTLSFTVAATNTVIGPGEPTEVIV